MFSTYLDQSIMFATTASVLWYLRKEGLWPAWLGALMALLALANSLLVLEGRSGYLVALSAIALAAMWAMPAKWRLPTLIGTPVIALAALALGSGPGAGAGHQDLCREPALRPNPAGGELDSSGWRPNAWKRSVQAFAQKPWSATVWATGHLPSSSLKVLTQSPCLAKATPATPSGVPAVGSGIGWGGLVLLLGFLASLCRDALRF